MYTHSCKIYRRRVRMEGSFLLFSLSERFCRQSRPSHFHLRVIFCSDGILRKKRVFLFLFFLGMWWVWGVVGWTLQQRFSFAFSGSDYIEIFYVSDSKRTYEPMVNACVKTKYVNHLMISTHCLEKGEMRVWIGKGRQILSWPFRRLFCRIEMNIWAICL